MGVGGRILAENSEKQISDNFVFQGRVSGEMTVFTNI